MNQQHNEMLSALFDGETNDFETRRLLQELNADDIAQWNRFQLLRDSARKTLGECNLDISVVSQVASLLQDEPAHSAGVQVSTSKGDWKKPLIGFATAASIGFVAVLGILQINHSQESGQAGFVADGNVSVSQLPIVASSGNGGVGLNTVSGSVQTSNLRQEIESIEAQKARERERLKFYIDQHAQFTGFSADNGLIPMARMSEGDN